MSPRSSSKIHREHGESRARTAAVALAVLSLAGALPIASSPLFAIGACPLAFGATDAAASYALGAPRTRARVRLVARALAAAAWGGAASTLVATRGAPSLVRLPVLASFLAVGALLGSFGVSGATAADGTQVDGPPRGLAALVGALDAATTAWCCVLAIAAHGRGAAAVAVMAVGTGLGLTLRALVIGRVLTYAVDRSDATSDVASVAAAGFVGWLTLASLACWAAGTSLTWSGLGAAVILTVAAALAESRRRRPHVLFARGSLAFAFATMLGTATLLGG